MKAIVQKTSGGPDTLEIGEVDIPIPKENEVLLKVKYSAVNRADIMQVCVLFLTLLQREGKYPPPPGATKIIGLECVGWVISDLDKDLEGEKYKEGPLYLALLPGGGYGS